jgi:hypothetical protein
MLNNIKEGDIFVPAFGGEALIYVRPFDHMDLAKDSLSRP